MSHSRAQLNAYARRLLCERIAAGSPVRLAARTLGISHARAYILWHRFTAEGERAFELRSSRSRHSPRRSTTRLEARIERARRARRWGPLRLQWLLGIARSTIYAVLRRLGLSRRRDLDPAPLPTRRYERPTPGDLIHLDTKKLGRLVPGGGKRFWELKVTGHGGAGWEYVHVAVNDRSQRAPRRAPRKRARRRHRQLPGAGPGVLRRLRCAGAPADDRQPLQLHPRPALPRDARGLGR